MDLREKCDIHRTDMKTLNCIRFYRPVHFEKRFWKLH